MAHKDWCGKPCSDCQNPCSLDENMPCSPDCHGFGDKKLCIGCDAKLIRPATCGDCGYFDRYENENDGFGGCDISCYTVHEDNDASECEHFPTDED